MAEKKQHTIVSASTGEKVKGKPASAAAPVKKETEQDFALPQFSSGL